MVFQEELTISTSRHGEMNDLTESVIRIVEQSGIQTGHVHIFNIGSTAAVGTIEFEPGLREDLPALLDRLIPPSPQFGQEMAWHYGNCHSQLQATLLGPSLTVPIRKGRPALGTWQQVIHLECDTRPRERTIIFTVMGQ